MVYLENLAGYKCQIRGSYKINALLLSQATHNERLDCSCLAELVLIILIFDTQSQVLQKLLFFSKFKCRI